MNVEEKARVISHTLAVTFQSMHVIVREPILDMVVTSFLIIISRRLREGRTTIEPATKTAVELLLAMDLADYAQQI